MIHELYPHNFSNFDRTIWNKKQAINRADQIICISNNTKKDLLKLFDIPEKKISVIHLGFESFNNEDLKIKIKPQFDRPYLLYVGNRGGYKNFLGFIKAISTSKKLMQDFDIVAFGGGRFSEGELRVIGESRFEVGQVKQVSGGDDLLASYYSSARAFIYPSIYEGFGIPPLEAMSHNCPVISSSTSSMPEIIGGAAEYFDPMDLDSIRNAIELTVYSDSRIAELNASGSRRLNLYSWDKCSQETAAIYAKLL
jgi:glycosyltransferase involved in cell wall biosynthesis